MSHLAKRAARKYTENPTDDFEQMVQAMAWFVVLIFGALLFGTGAMLAPALPTQQPRVALSAVLSLALIIGGAVWWAAMFAWDTLIIDYLVFALVSATIIGGTLSYGQARAEKEGQTLNDAAQGWVSRVDLIGFACVLMIAMIVLGLLRTEATLDPTWWITPTTDASTFAAPALPALHSYLTHQLNQSTLNMDIGISAVMYVLGVWLMYDMAAEAWPQRPHWRRGAALLGAAVLLLCLVVQVALLPLLFGGAALCFALRFGRARLWIDVLCGGLLLGALALYSMWIAVGLAVVMGILALWSMFSITPSQPKHTWALALIGFPLVALVALAPWLWRLAIR
jgi:hypothetical protein